MLREDCRVLDLGCGLGLLMQDLKALGFPVTGVDIDPVCVEQATVFGPCQVHDIATIDEVFDEDSFDIAVLSHALEHMERPRDVLRLVERVSRRWIVVAVPNPARVEVLLKDLFRKRYSNKGHFYSWDRSHLANFLETHCELKIEEWRADYVRLVPFRILRRILTRIGLLHALEGRLAPRALPFFSGSLIARCRVRKD